MNARGRGSFEFVAHHAPVLLALFCLAVSLAGDEFYEGFSEGQPATWLSLGLIATCLVLVVAALRRDSLEPARRRVGFVLVPLILAAMADERFGGHEAIGDFVKKNATFLPRQVRHYTDDVLIILAALFGAALLWALVRRVREPARYLPYLVPVALLALAHGVFDLLAHGRYVWNALFPEMPLRDQKYLVDVLSFYEESCKLWTEWFVVLFCARFFYDRRGPLLWTAAAACGMAVAPLGVWALQDVDAGIPFLFVGGELEYVRNHPTLAGLAVVWIVWAVAVYRGFPGDERRQAWAGLFLVAPLPMLLPRVGLLEALTPAEADWRVLGMQAGALLLGGAAWLLRGRVGLLAAGLACLPLAALDWPVAVIAACGVAWVQALRRLEAIAPERALRWGRAAIALQLVAIVGILSFFRPTPIPKIRYRTEGMAPFEIGRQTIPFKRRPAGARSEVAQHERPDRRAGLQRGGQPVAGDRSPAQPLSRREPAVHR